MIGFTEPVQPESKPKDSVQSQSTIEKYEEQNEKDKYEIDHLEDRIAKLEHIVDKRTSLIEQIRDYESLLNETY